MRKVVKAVFRSFGASLATNSVNLESQPRTDLTKQMKRRDICYTDSCSRPVSAASLDICRNFDVKVKSDSLSPVYKLCDKEISSFEELQDKECDYYPNISARGDTNVLNLDMKSNINEQNVNSFNIISSLKNIRFMNSFVFHQNPDVFLITTNFIQRLIHFKVVKKDLMGFVCAAMYDLALEHSTDKALTDEQVALLLSVTNIPVNHIEDFSRMKSLLLNHLNNDLQSVSIVDYLEVILRINLRQHHSSDFTVPESHQHLMDLTAIFATSCELTHFSLACQAVTLANVAARHISFEPSFHQEYSRYIDGFPMIFLSPVRLYQFARLDNITDHNIRHCAESMVRFVSMYYDRCRRPLAKSGKSKVKALSRNEESSPRLSVVVEEEEADTRDSHPSLNVTELMEKLSRVKMALHSPVTGKQKQRNRRAKKKLSRQLKKYDLSTMERMSYKPMATDEGDSAIASSSSMASPVSLPGHARIM